MNDAHVARRAREGSLRAAPKTLNVTQPTVGRRVSGFDHALGVEAVHDDASPQRRGG